MRQFRETNRNVERVRRHILSARPLGKETPQPMAGHHNFVISKLMRETVPSPLKASNECVTKIPVFVCLTSGYSPPSKRWLLVMPLHVGKKTAIGAITYGAGSYIAEFLHALRRTAQCDW